MASEQQFGVASDFVRAYKDALLCVEQIAERRQSYLHYEREAGTYTNAIAQNQLEVTTSGQVKAGANASGFTLVGAFEKSKAAFQEQGFGSASSRSELISKLDQAINDTGKSARLDL